MAWAGKILRVDLTAGTVKSEPLNMAWAKEYLGSRGLGSKYLSEEIDPKVDPLSPGNKIIWATGPLTGTMASTGGRYTVITKGPLTGAIACSNSGGYWGAELKMAGWDMVIFEGKSAKPVYLYVNDDVAELRDAAHLWGGTVWHTEEQLKKDHQDPLLRISSIGGAGENQVLFAAVVNDLHRAAGRSGVGAVMGSKNLKAVAVRGDGGVRVARPADLMEKVKRFERNILEKSALVGTYRQGGTLGAYLIPGENRPHGVRNLNEAFWGSEALQGVSREKFDQYRLRKHGCSNCPVHCSAVFKVDDLLCEGVQANSLRAFGSNVDVSSARDILYAHGLCNRYGLDVDQTSAVIAWAIDCFEQGILTPADTGGRDLRFSDGGCVAALIRMIAQREGFGDLLAQGVFEASKTIGRGSEKLAAVVKKNSVMEAAMRSHKAWALGIVTSTRGTGHLRGAPGLEFQ